MINHKFSIFVTSPIKLIAMIVLYFICKLQKRKVQVIRADRIGHFVPDGYEAIIRRGIEAESQRDFYVFSDSPVNIQWKIMLKRKLPILPGIFYSRFLEKKLKFFGKIYVNATKFSSRDKFGWYERYPQFQIEFNNTENKKATKFLEKFGIDKNRFICILIRDDDYLNSINYAGIDFSYHSYRNSDVNSYISGIKFLIHSGYHVIRIGRNTKKQIRLSHPKFIDLNYNSQSSDFLDIWLAANATAMISTGTGHDVVASIYHKPVLFINFLPLMSIHSFHKTITVPKILRWKKSKKILSVKEYLDHSYYHTTEFTQRDICISDLSENEIEKSFEEFVNYIKNDQGLEVSIKQKIFWEQYQAHPLTANYTNHISSHARMGEIWLNLLEK